MQYIFALQPGYTGNWRHQQVTGMTGTCRFSATLAMTMIKTHGFT
jgi:hypothetical protein